MPSSVTGQNESRHQRVSSDENVVVPDGAPPSDDTPTVISKTLPTDEKVSSSSQKKIIDLAHKTTPDEIVAGLRGKRLAHFKLIEPIGVGGMAAVIRARDTQLDRFVALKILPPEMAHEQENIDRFHQEAKAAARLDHDTIARVFFCGADQGLNFIAFEFVEGVNLRKLLEQRGRLPVAEAVRYVLQVATGLEHAATRGVVHRDVKPSNIIVTPTGRAKLVDMGLARNLERQGQRDLTQSGVTLGTFDYISPEQALEPREADMRSDIYSLGCTLYHLLTGIPPVPEGTPAKKLQHHQHHQPVDPRQFNPAIPVELVMILGKMIAKDPKDRYQRPIHLVHHLLQVAKTVGAADNVPEGLFVDAPLPGQPPRNRPFLAIGLGLAALCMITVVLMLVPGPTPTTVKKDSSYTETKDKSVTPVNADVGKGDSKKDVKPPVMANTVATDRTELEQILKSNAKEIDARIQGAIEGGLVFRGAKDQRLKLGTVDDDAEWNWITLEYSTSTAPYVLLVEGGEEVEFHRIKFEIDATKAPAQAVAGVTLRGVKKARFKNCIFTQNALPMRPKKASVASLNIEGLVGADAGTIVTLDQCLFDLKDKNAQVAIAVNGPATVNITNCAFRSHGAIVHFRKDCSKEKTLVNMQNCATYLVNGPAFRLAPQASAHVQSRFNVFSRPGDGAESPITPEGGLQPDLIYLPPDDTASIKYIGEENVYHNPNAYVGLVTTLEQFKDSFLAKGNGRDLNSLEPKSLVFNAPSRGDELAFQLKPGFAKYGLQKTWLGNDMPNLSLAKVAGPASQPKVKIVDPDEKTPGAFRNLAGAIGEAQNGDTILIKHGDNPLVALPPVSLTRSITIKAFDGYHPVLVLDRSLKDLDSALFKIQDSKLTIEQMEILLDPAQTDGAAHSIVHMGETAHCVFKNCILTLRTGGAAQLNVATFIDLDRMMKTEAPLPVSSARVEFHECFVRGKGDLVALNGCRLLNVDIKNSLIALNGSLLDIEASTKVMPMERGVRWTM